MNGVRCNGMRMRMKVRMQLKVWWEWNGVVAVICVDVLMVLMDIMGGWMGGFWKGGG